MTDKEKIEQLEKRIKALEALAYPVAYNYGNKKAQTIPKTLPDITY